MHTYDKQKKFVTVTHGQIANRVHTKLKPYQPDSTVHAGIMNGINFAPVANRIEIRLKTRGNATDTNSRISNRVHMELKPLSTLFHPYRNRRHFLTDSGEYHTAAKRFWSCSKLCTDFNSMLISVLVDTRFKPHRLTSNQSIKPYRPLSIAALFWCNGFWQGSSGSLYGSRWSFGANRVDKELVCVTMWVYKVDPGEYGFTSVWTRFKIWPCVTVHNFPSSEIWSV
jgi:hypothetical protein